MRRALFCVTVVLACALFWPQRGGSAGTYYFIARTGQSLSIGFNSGSALTTTQPYGNLMLSGANGGTGSGVSLIPLVEGSSIESESSATANQITYLASGTISIVASHGITGQPYSGIKKGGTAAAYANGQTQLTRAIAAAGANTVVCAAVVLTHGETDFINSVTATDYEADIVQMQSDYQTDCRAQLGTPTARVPLITDQMSTWTHYTRYTPRYDNTTPSTPIGQWWAARDYPDRIYIAAPKYQLAYSDGLHLTAESYRWLGWKHGQVIKRVVLDRARWVPASPRSIRQTANTTIEVLLNSPDGSDFTTDTTTVSDATGALFNASNHCAYRNKGFEYWDDSCTGAGPNGCAVIVSNVSVSGKAVTLTLSGTPTGTLASRRVRYAFSGVQGTAAGAADAAHGNIRNTSVAVGLDGSTPLYDWLIAFDEPLGFAWGPVGLFPLPGPVLR